MQHLTNTKAVMARNSRLIMRYLQASLLIQTLLQKMCSEKAFCCAAVVFTA